MPKNVLPVGGTRWRMGVGDFRVWVSAFGWASQVEKHKVHSLNNRLSRLCTLVNLQDVSIIQARGSLYARKLYQELGVMGMWERWIKAVYTGTVSLGLKSEEIKQCEIITILGSRVRAGEVLMSAIGVTQLVFGPGLVGVVCRQGKMMLEDMEECNDDWSHFGFHWGSLGGGLGGDGIDAEVWQCWKMIGISHHCLKCVMGCNTPTLRDTLEEWVDRIWTHKQTSTLVILMFIMNNSRHTKEDFTYHSGYPQRSNWEVPTALGMVEHPQVELQTNVRAWTELAKWHKLESDDTTSALKWP